MPVNKTNVPFTLTQNVLHRAENASKSALRLITCSKVNLGGETEAEPSYVL